MGRVRVQFPWQMAKNQMTPWLRITTLYAGAGKGMYMIPEIGEEVLVAYESNNAEKPFVLGALYNGAETSGYATADNDLKVFKTRSGIEDLKNDAEGSWKRSTPDGSFIHQDGQGNININATNNLNITVGKDMRVNIGENMTYFVGINSFFNSGTNITMTTPEMKQYIADYYHTQAGKALINSDNEIKIEAKQTKVAGFEKVLVHSNDSTVINSKKIVDIKGQEGTNHTNVAEDMADNEIILDAMALVVFRPHESWVTNWNYNIDWFREGFGGGTAIGGTSIKGDEDFYTIAGHYLNNDQKNSFTLDTVIADNLKSEYLKAVGQQKDPIQEEGKPTKYIPYDYYIPRLTIYKHEAEAEQTIANITINYDVYEEPNKLILEYEEEFFEISEYKDPNEVVLIGKSNKPPKVEEKVDYTPPEKHKIYEIKSKSVTKTSFRSANISIECKQPFGTLGGKFINAYTLQKGEDGKIIKKQAGVLQVMPNNASYRKTLNIVMINVITDIDADGAVENGYDATLLEKEKKHLRILLRQSLIDPVFSTIDLHFDGKSTGTITTRDHFNSTYISSGALLSAYERGSTIPTGWKNLDIYLNDKFQELSESPNYTNHTKLFYLPQSDLMIVQNNVPTAYGGYNSGSNHLNIVLPKQGSKYASSHEAYHRLGLPHTWQNKNNLDRIGGFHPSENNGKYSFKYGTTFNIMDYCSEKYYLYYWQMQIACSSATAEPANYIPQIL